MLSFTFSLNPIPPFRLDLTTWALRRRPNNRIDRFDQGTYSRILALGDTPVEVSISQPGSSQAPRVEVHVKGHRYTKTRQSQIATTVEKVFGMRIDLSPFYRMATQDERLALLARRFLGLKPPRFPSVFEAAVNGIACQQLSLNVGILLLGRLSEACAPSMSTDSGLQYAFPRPHDVMKLSIVDLRGLGFSTRKAQFLLELSESSTTGRLDLDGLVTLGRQQAIEFLTRLKGIGRWTAEYMLLRGLGDLTGFPGDDVGGRNKLRGWLGMEGPLTYDSVQKITAKWKPYPGLIYFHLLLDELSKKVHFSLI